MKVCRSCGKERTVQEFAKKSTCVDGLQTECKICKRAYSKLHYEANKQRYLSRTKSNKAKIRDKFHRLKRESRCFLCGENEPCCLDFHHLDPKTKEFNLSLLTAYGVSWKRVLLEIKKCTVLCSNCHRKVHAGLITL